MSFPRGLILTDSGTTIVTTYVAGGTSSTIGAGVGVSRLRFYVHAVTAATSDLTTVTVKLQQRYNDGTALGWIDLPSDKGDASKTFEIEHALTVAANGTYDFTFFLDNPAGTSDLQCLVKANATGKSGDVITVYAA